MTQRDGPSRRARIAQSLLFGVALWAGAGFLRSCVGDHPLREDPLQPSAARLLADDHLELARRYAPLLFKGVHPTRGRQDLPAPVDFDGNLRGDDNWDHFARYELVPTVYYAVLETETHLFLTYHVFHPRDWSLVDLGLHLTHENDGENLQVVVDKASQRPVLLFTQAHYEGGVYADPGSGFDAGTSPVRGPFLLVDANGRVDPGADHVAVHVESGGHGIYGVPDDASPVAVDTDGRLRPTESGLVFRPARPGEAVVEPDLRGEWTSGEPVPYRLESTTAKLWPGLATGELVGEGGLVDGALLFESRWVTVDVPRYYEGDRFSGPFGPDRGISPFAVDFRFGAGEVGALFFDPAGRYAERLRVPEPWSLEYVDYPFRREP